MFIESSVGLIHEQYDTNAAEFPAHDPITYRVEEADTIVERNHFVCRFLEARTHEKLD